MAEQESNDVSVNDGEIDEDLANKLLKHVSHCKHPHKSKFCSQPFSNQTANETVVEGLL